MTELRPDAESGNLVSFGKHVTLVAQPRKQRRKSFFNDLRSKLEQAQIIRMHVNSVLVLVMRLGLVSKAPLHRAEFGGRKTLNAAIKSVGVTCAAPHKHAVVLHLHAQADARLPRKNARLQAHEKADVQQRQAELRVVNAQIRGRGNRSR